jgi:hypothetical protein
MELILIKSLDKEQIDTCLIYLEIYLGTLHQRSTGDKLVSIPLGSIYYWFYLRIESDV